MVHALNYMYHTMPYQQIQALKDLDSNTDRFLLTNGGRCINLMIE